MLPFGRASEVMTYRREIIFGKIQKVLKIYTFYCSYRDKAVDSPFGEHSVSESVQVELLSTGLFVVPVARGQGVDGSLHLRDQCIALVISHTALLL